MGGYVRWRSGEGCLILLNGNRSHEAVQLILNLGKQSVFAYKNVYYKYLSLLIVLETQSKEGWVGSSGFLKAIFE